jgi:hypothetical protein
MGFFSSLFGSKRSSEPSSTVVQAQSIPKEVAPYLKEVLEGYQDLYQNQLERGYQEYGGETIAPLTSAQESALSGLEGLRGTTQPMYETAAEKAIGAGQQFTPEAAQQYMSPYQQAVTDVELREAQRRFEGDVLPKLEAQAVGAGAMSGLGSRAGVEMAEAQRSQNQLLADIQAKGSQKAFEQASKQFEAERGRERLVGQDLSKLAGQGLTSQITELGAQKAVGEERQQLGQLNLDEAYRKYLEKQEFPETALTTYSGGVYGNPMSRTFDTNTTNFAAQPSTGQSLLSLGLSGLGMYGMGKNIYNSKEGGYVDQGLPTVYRAESGPANSAASRARSLARTIRERNEMDQADEDINDGSGGLAIGQNIGNIFERIQQALSSKEVTPERKIFQDASNLGLAIAPPPTSSGPDNVRRINEELGRLRVQKVNPFETIGDKAIRVPREKELQKEKAGLLAGLETDAYASENPVGEGMPGDIVDVSKEEMIEGDKQDKKELLAARIKAAGGEGTGSDINVAAAMEGSFKTPKTTTDKTPKTASSSKSFLNDLISSNMKYNTMIDKKITSMGELQTQLKDAIEADKTGTKESRNRSNELAFWRSLLIAGGAVGAADPTKGFLNALAKGATAGGKSLVDARMKLEKEARGDGKKAIDAIKTLMVAETADLKLMQAGVDSKRKLVDSLAKWAKANNVKVDYKKLGAVSSYAKTAVDNLGLDPKDADMKAAAGELIVKRLAAYIAAGMPADNLPTMSLAEVTQYMKSKPKSRIEGSPSSNKGKAAGSVLDN